MDDQIQEIRPNRNKQSSMIGETEKLSRDHRDKVTLARMGKKQVLKVGIAATVRLIEVVQADQLCSGILVSYPWSAFALSSWARGKA